MRSHLIARAAVVACCVGLAVLVLASGADRLSDSDLRWARRVPHALAARADAVRAREFLRQTDYAQAAYAAADSIRHDPYGAAGPALLGEARGGLNDPAGAERAFAIGRRLGWREQATQSYWMKRAIAAGDSRLAARHADAMLRLDPTLGASREVIAAMEASGELRAALAGRLVLKPEWLEWYARLVWDLDPRQVATRADVLGRLARLGHPLGCGGAGGLTNALVQAGLVGTASEFWRLQCAARGQGLLADTGFTRLQGQAEGSMFDWSPIPQADVSVSLAAAGNGSNHLSLASSASFPRKVMTQLVPLAPGQYRLAWSARDEAGAPRRRLVAVVACDAGSHDWIAAAPQRAPGAFAGQFTVDDACAARWLSFAILPGAGVVSFGDVSLQRSP